MSKRPDFNDFARSGVEIPDLDEISDEFLEDFPPEGDRPDDGDGRPEIRSVPGRLMESVRDAERALVRRQALVYLFDDGAATVRWRDGENEAARVTKLDKDHLIGILAENTKWARLKTDGKGTHFVDGDPPERVAKTILAGMQSSALPRLKALAHCPLVLPDGRLIATPGLDLQSGIYAAFRRNDFAGLKPSPDKSDAQAALAELLEPFSDFCFEDPAGPYAVVAATLTLCCRSAIDDAVPMFVVTSSTPGTGKSKIVAAVSTIAIGYEPPRMAQTDDTEFEKRVTALLLEGCPVIFIDNAEEALGGKALNALLTTSANWGGRHLGVSRMAALAARAVTFATGNNLTIAGDLRRRVVPIVLTTELERPEERQGFKIPDLKKYLRQHRNRLAVAAITMVQAYLAATDPVVVQPQLGGYEEWSRIVRGAIVWAGGKDPLATRAAILAEPDETAMAFGELLAQLLATFEQNSFTAADVVGVLANHQDLKHALFGDKNVDGNAVGGKLRYWRKRIVGGLRVMALEVKTGGVKHWTVVAPAAQPATEAAP